MKMTFSQFLFCVLMLPVNVSLVYAKFMWKLLNHFWVFLCQNSVFFLVERKTILKFYDSSCTLAHLLILHHMKMLSRSFNIQPPDCEFCQNLNILMKVCFVHVYVTCIFLEDSLLDLEMYTAGMTSYLLLSENAVPSILPHSGIKS